MHPESNEIHLTRTYDAPLKAVWEAWSDPARLAQWWGPRGFTLTTHQKDLRPGGSWTYTMHGPDGVDYPNHTVYHEVEPLAKLVYDHGANDNQPPLFRVTVRFAENAGRTTMDMRMALPSAEAARQTRTFIKAAGGDATWDRLAEYLEKEASGKDVFVINRSFDAPVDTLFDAWTRPGQLAQWLPPSGFRMEFIRSDIATGGSAFYLMTNGPVSFHGRSEYLDIARPTRIAYTQQFCDALEKAGRHPMAPIWPETALTTVSLAPEGPARTRATVRMEVHGPATAQEREVFASARAGMTQGWSGSFDKLGSYLADGSKA